MRRHRTASVLFLAFILVAALAASWVAYEATRPGTLVLHVAGATEPTLLIDGIPTSLVKAPGESPEWIAGPLRLARGRHRLEASLVGRDAMEREFEIAGGRTLDLSVELKRSTGRLSIFSDPENCELVLEGAEGQLRLTTPLSDHPVPTGDYTARIGKKNHFGQSFDLSVNAGERLPSKKVFLESLHVWSCSLPGSKSGTAGECRVGDVDGDGADDMLVFTAGSSLTCISGMWGRILWSRTGNWPPGKKCVGDFDGDGGIEILLLEPEAGGKVNLLCLESATGVEVWRREFKAVEGRESQWDRGFNLSLEPLAIDDDGRDDFLLLGAGLLRAYSGYSDKPVWTTEVGHGGLPYLTPGEGGLAYLLGSYNLTALKSETGKVLWTEELPDYVSPVNALTPGDLDADGVGDLISWSENKVFFVSGGEKEVLWDRNLGPPGGGNYFDDFGEWYLYGSGTRTQWGVDRVKVVQDMDGDGCRDLLVHNKAHKNILTCVSGAAGTKVWDTVLPGPLRAMGDPVDLDGDGRFEIPMSFTGDRVGLLEEGRGENVRWIRKGIHLTAWRGATADFDLDGVLDLVVPGDDNQVHAFSGKTGRILWLYQLDSRVGSFAFERPGTGEGAASGIGILAGDFDGSGSMDGLVVITDRKVLRLRPRPGETKWMASAGGDGAIAYAGEGETERIIAVTLDGRILHYRTRDGQQIKQIRIRARGEGISEIRLADWDGDGYPDPYVFESGGQRVDVVSGMDGRPLKEYYIPLGAEVRCISDLNGDGKPDILAVPDGDEALRCLCGASGQTLWKVEHDGPSWAYRILSLDLCDVDGDETPEVIAAVHDSTREGSGEVVIVSRTGRWGEWITEEINRGRRWIGLEIRRGRDGSVLGTVELQSRGGSPKILGLFGKGDTGPPIMLIGNGAEVIACQLDLKKLKTPVGEGKKVPSLGTPKWRFPVRGQVTSALTDPTSDTGVFRVIVADSTGDLFCLDLEEGSLVWAARLGRPVRRLARRNETGNSREQIVALGERTVSMVSRGGEALVWETTLPDSIVLPPRGRFRTLVDLDGDGSEDLTLPLSGGKVVGILPERKPFKKRSILFDVEDRTTMGEHLETTGRPEGALSWLERVIGDGEAPAPLKARAHHRRGKALLTLKKPDEALESFSRSIEIDPARSSVRLDRGLLLIERKKDHEAEAD
ncbi:MAG: FG-GAP-like repeat-containing protein, partial [Planctomycetota bacterium]